MRKASLPGFGLLLFFISSPAEPETSMQAFSAKRVSIDGVPIVRLADAVRGIEVSVLPSAGNIAYEMKINGRNILVSPEGTLSEFVKNPDRGGVPFMAPWANRMDGSGFWANGKKYDFNMALGNVLCDGRGLPIHGLLMNSPLWRVTDVGADSQSAHVTSKLEFWNYPDLMAQWPFAHEYEMTHILRDGALEVKTTVSNLSAEAMPLVIGFHPYYRIPGVPRDHWILRLPAHKEVDADERLIPTGELRNRTLPDPLPLKSRTLDDGFTDFERNADGIARIFLESGEKRIEVLLGPGYPVALIWVPASSAGLKREFICIEPMTGITNGINLHHAGKYDRLQTVPAGGRLSASFWIRGHGF